ncbi:MAG TPA: TonB-dependent receptor [Thermoanaerobaculia bacterium]|nr:TonB-dependent receptor [Thermoanaerobaculia bacterium]
MRRIFLIAGILGGGIPVLAQTASTTLPSFEDSVVVSASLESADRADVPASVTVITAEEIEARQAETLTDVLATVPGLRVAQSGSAGQQTSVFVRGAESDQVLLLWNGIPLNSAYFGEINWQFVPTDGVERVEVVRGPFSALYGSNAVGGVVQVFTGAQDGGRVTLEAGQNDHLRGGLAASYQLGNARLDVTGHARRGEGELPNDFFDSEELMVRSLWTLTPGTTLGLLLRGNDSETGIPLSGLTPSLRRKISWEEREVAVPLRSQLGDWEVEAQLSQSWFDSAFRDPDDDFGFVASDTEAEAQRGRAVATWRFQPEAWIAVGTEVERLEVTSSSSFGPELDAESQRTWAVFGQGSYGLGRVRLEAGVRRDDNNVYGAETSLRGGLVVELSRSARLRASYGEAFRAPSLGELFFPGSGNPELQPETGESYELGFDAEAGPWRFSLTGFENRQTNLISFDFVDFRNINIGRAKSRGVEAEAGLQQGIYSARLSATWLETEDQDTGLALLRRPEESAALMLTARPGDFTFNLEGRYVGEREDVDPVTFGRAGSPSYTRLDAAARWRALPWLAPYARVENVADEEYQEVLGFPSPGRTFIGGLAVDF